MEVPQTPDRAWPFALGNVSLPPDEAVATSSLGAAGLYDCPVALYNL